MRALQRRHGIAMGQDGVGQFLQGCMVFVLGWSGTGDRLADLPPTVGFVGLPFMASSDSSFER